MLLPIILQEETAVLRQGTADRITADRATAIPEITEMVTEAIRGVITVGPVISLWEEIPGPTARVPEVVLQVTVEVLQDTEEVRLV
jgi:hypothetical protein